MEEALKQIKSNCKKIVLYGPESTGKTTLSIELAKHYKTNWVPEYAREYLQTIWDNEKRICEPRSFLENLVILSKYLSFSILDQFHHP